MKLGDFMEKILIVEDEETIRLGLKYYLEAENYIAKEAKTAKEAIEIVNQEEIDLVLLDINLPDEDGYYVFEKIKQKKDIPVIFLTSRVDKEGVQKVLEFKPNGYLSKSLSPEVIKKEIDNFFRKS